MAGDAGALTVRGLSKRFGRRKALSGVSLGLGRGQVGLLLGPNASGKTTLLKCIAGLLEPDEGEIYIGGEAVFSRNINVPPELRDVGYVPSRPVLFEHLTVWENVALGARRKRGLRGAELDERVRWALGLLSVEDYARARPRELSHGTRQRVAIAMAVAMEPRVLLMDEPLANVDPVLKPRLRLDIARLARELGIAVLMATNLAEDAVALGDVLYVLEGGELVYSGPLLHDAAISSRFLASSLGYGVIPAKVLGREGDGVLVETPAGLLVASAVRGKGEQCWAVIRPEGVEPAEDPAGRGTIACEETAIVPTPLGLVSACRSGDAMVFSRRPLNGARGVRVASNAVEVLCE